MAGNLATLAARMRALRVAIPAYSNARKVEMATAIHNTLLERTPVDVGTAVSNWQLTLNEPAEDVLNAFDPSPRGRMMRKGGVNRWTHAVAPALTREANITVALEGREAALEVCKSGDIIFIANNAPYIVKLDQGSSAQAPEGFTDAALLVGTTAFESSALELES
jgi:hypothetical protein